jgi:hypothetical protein
LDCSDGNDVTRLQSLGIDKEQAAILSAFFFPRKTRTIAYSPEPGRFVEAQTTYNAECPSHKTDTTIIQIQEKQLSSDHHAMQRQIVDERTSPIPSKSTHESEPIMPATNIVHSHAIKNERSPPTTPVYIKKRKSTGNIGLFSCFKSKKPKSGSEQHGQPTLPINETNMPTATIVTNERPLIDYAILPDGRRVYIDAFRARPGLDMSYQPHDFNDRFVLPIVSVNEHNRDNYSIDVFLCVCVCVHLFRIGLTRVDCCVYFLLLDCRCTSLLFSRQPRRTNANVR